LHERGQSRSSTTARESIKEGISRAGERYATPQSFADQTVEQLRTMIEGLRAVPVQHERHSIESVDASEKPPLAFEPDVRQG
jgi:hypothetical protein